MKASLLSLVHLIGQLKFANMLSGRRLLLYLCASATWGLHAAQTLCFLRQIDVTFDFQMTLDFSFRNALWCAADDHDWCTHQWELMCMCCPRSVQAIVLC